MSGTAPFFVTGASAKIKINGKTLAFCSDVSYTVQIITQAPKVLGYYESISVEPLGYNVSGSFTLIRYVKNAVGNIGTLSGTVNSGNGAKNWNNEGVGANTSNDIQTNPADLENATTFDLEIYQKIEVKHGPDTSGGDVLGVAKIRGCRITQADFIMSKKTVATQKFTFIAQFADEDSFTALQSGRGQAG